MGALLAHQWNLPKSYALAMDHHHRLFSETRIKVPIPLQGTDVLSGMLHLSDLCNAFYTCHDKSGALMGLKERDGYASGLKKELGAAREIQKRLQSEGNLFSGIRAFNIPASYLSGDFFDYFQKEDGRIYFCLGDVSGKGTGAALLMAKAVSMLRCLCRFVTDISTVVEIMNNELCETAVRGRFVTFVGGWFDIKNP